MIELRQLNKTYPSKTGPFTALTNINFDRQARGNFWRDRQKRRRKKFFDPQCQSVGTPTSGSVLIDGEDLTRLVCGKIAYRPPPHWHDLSSILICSTHRTVLDNIALPLELSGQRQDHQTARSIAFIELVGLSDKRTCLS